MEEVGQCPPPVWVYAGDTSRDSAYDDWNERMASDGCVRHYGKGACLVKMIKMGKDNFHAICRRADGQTGVLWL